MSAPAMNAFSPEPVSVATRMAASFLISVNADRNSSIVAMLSAFSTLGRLTVTYAIEFFFSSRMFSKVISLRSYFSPPRHRVTEKPQPASRLPFRESEESAFRPVRQQSPSLCDTPHSSLISSPCLHAPVVDVCERIKTCPPPDSPGPHNHKTRVQTSFHTTRPSPAASAAEATRSGAP